jgi:hypothetical protein
MPTLGKVFAIAVLVLTIPFLLLSVGVLKAREQWDKKIKQKADEAAKMAALVETLASGTQEVLGPGGEFEKLADEVLRNASDAARKEFRERRNQGLAPTAAFEIAFDLFVDQQVIDRFQQAIKGLNDIQRTTPIDESQFNAAVAAYTAAERDLAQARTDLENGYMLFLGQTLQNPGVRGLATKGMGIEPLKTTVNRVQQAIVDQRTVFEVQLSDGDKNLTSLRDRVQAEVDRANKMKLAALAADQELTERTKEVAQLKQDLADEEATVKRELQKLDEMIAALDDLKERFAKATEDSRNLVALIKERELRIDAMRGPVVLSANGRVPKGKIQQVDPDSGDVRINIGARLGVKPGVQLHVYRLNPEAKYLGLLEVTQSDSDSAVGRMLPEYRQLPVQAGDNVAPEITR